MTRVLNLDADEEAAVDMMLVYLYTLEIPVAFSPQKGTFDDAEHAYLMGDKYQLSDLKLAGYNYMMASITTMLKESKLQQDPHAVDDWTVFVKKLWVNDFPDAEHFQDIILDKLVDAAQFFMDNETFQDFIGENVEFNGDFMRALVRCINVLKRLKE